MPITCDRLVIPPGSTLTIQANWDEFNDILQELGDRRSSHIAYQNNQLDIMVPLPAYTTAKGDLEEFIEILFAEFGTNYRSLGSVSLQNAGKLVGIEPGNCFYIQNSAGNFAEDIDPKPQEAFLNLENAPPPDLVLEIDISSRNYLDIYAELGVPEVWHYSEESVRIKRLDVENKTYQVQWNSQYFHGLLLSEALPLYLERIETDGHKRTMNLFQAWVREQLGKASVVE